MAEQRQLDKLTKKELVALLEGAAAPRPERKIAIFGTTPSRMEGPHQDNSGWERWTIGPGGKDVHGWERLFEIHGTWPADFNGYLNDLSKVKPPQQVVTLSQTGDSWANAIARWKHQHKLPDSVIEGDWSAVVRYPREEMIARYGRRMWFSSSIAWCIALAIEEGATDIGCWGIDLESGEEYISQFVGCAFLLDYARLKGINIYLPDGCGLLRDPAPYPDRYENLLALTLERKVKWLDAQLGQISGQHDSTKAEVHRLEGKLLAAREWRPDKADAIERELLNHNIKYEQQSAQLHQLRGELGASQFYRRMFVWGFNEPEAH